MSNFVSIIIPGREEEKLIGETIAQFKKISAPHEIIVSDDGSSDRTVEIARQNADKVLTYTGDIHVISRARNAGARAAVGDILIFADADAYLPDPDAYVNRALSHFAADPNLAGIATPQRVRTEIERAGDIFVFGLDNTIVRILNNVFKHGAGCGKLMFIRKNAFERIGGFNEKLIFREDADLMARLSHVGKTIYDPRLTVYHSGRRLHRLGVIRFYFSWISNGIGAVFFGRARDREWTPVR